MSVFSDRASTGVVDGGLQTAEALRYGLAWNGHFLQGVFLFQRESGPRDGFARHWRGEVCGTSPCFLEGGNRGLQSVAVPDLILCTLRTVDLAKKAGLMST